VGYCSTRAQVPHAAPVVFPVVLTVEHVYRVHPINVQLVTDSVIMPANEEHGCDSGSEFVLAMDVIVCTAAVGNVLRTSVCTSPTVLEAEVLWSGLEFVMMVALDLKFGRLLDQVFYGQCPQHTVPK
jgi:hypothetical protein